MVMGERFKNKVKGKNCCQYDYLDDVVCSMVGGENLSTSISE